MAKKKINLRKGLPKESDGVTLISGLYEEWFLDYASYVILERAVPAIEDGLKPVQRRILHSMKETDDGRFNKVANIIGNTMQYHPHGDAAIGDALVKIGQKDLLIETQGNWGDPRTGDSAAAPRYIEARLSKFALAVCFNKQTTNWQASYDGRKNEPIKLPVKFPLILAMGVEGIAVGLSTKIMPHNFCELIQASIDHLRKKKINLYPDFPSGGYMDVTEYNEGRKGSKIKLRANIEVVDKNTLVINNIPHFSTTSNLIDSIVKAHDQGKIKIKKVIDNTAEHVEIEIQLPNGTSTDLIISALYAFTDCEISVSPSATVIIDEKPHFCSVNDLLKMSTINTVELLNEELKIRKQALDDKWHYSSLEKIFIENRIYRDIEEVETWEGVIEAIDKGLKPFKKILRRKVTRDDIIRLTEIKIKRISKYDAFKADEAINQLEKDMKEVDHHLKHLRDYAIDYFKNLLEKFGKGRERKTEIREFDTIKASRVIMANEKLYVNRADGFIGYQMRKEEFVQECSRLDDVIVFNKDCTFKVVRVSDKKFVGKNIIHCEVWKKGDERKVYHYIYQDSKTGKAFAKRFAVTSITREKEYDLSAKNKNSKLLYFSVQANSESELVEVKLSSGSRARVKVFEFDFGELAIKGRGSKGNTITKYPVRSIKQLELGSSSIGGRKVWYDENQAKLNTENRGRFIGEFEHDECIISIAKDGSFKVQEFDMNLRFDVEKTVAVEKYTEALVVSAIHYSSENQQVYIKRFEPDAKVFDKDYPFINEGRGSKLLYLATNPKPKVNLKLGTKRKHTTTEIEIEDFISIKSWKAMGNKLTDEKIFEIEPLNNALRDNDKKSYKAGDKVELSVDKKNDAQGNLF